MIESVRDNPNASIFGEPLGVVCFDPDMSKKMKEWNKSRIDHPKAFNHNQTLIEIYIYHLVYRYILITLIIIKFLV